MVVTGPLGYWTTLWFLLLTGEVLAREPAHGAPHLSLVEDICVLTAFSLPRLSALLTCSHCQERPHDLPPGSCRGSRDG